MSKLPATVADLNVEYVTKVLAKHSCNVTDAAKDLGVPTMDLRRLLWANSGLQGEAAEIVERRLDKAEKNVFEALNSEDSRRRDAASFFVLRNTAASKRRGWIPAAGASVDVSVNVTQEPRREVVFRWRTEEDDRRDRERAEQERLEAERERLEAEAKRNNVLTFGGPKFIDGDGG